MKRRVYNNIIGIHVLVGMAIFYFFVHPLTMVIYSFEIHEIPFTLNRFIEIAPQKLMSSFSFQMTGMSIAFVVIGSIVGLGSGIYYKHIIQNSKLLNLQRAQLKMNILSIIKEGESDQVEFKSSLRYDYYQKSTNKGLESIIVKTIVGFLNTKGGKLLIGVDDNGSILGLKNDYISLKKKDKDGFELKIYQLITDEIGIGFCSLVQVDFYEIDEDDICVLYISPAPSPAYVHGNNKTAFYIRVGNSTKPLTIQDAVKYIKGNWE